MFALAPRSSCVTRAGSRAGFSLDGPRTLLLGLASLENWGVTGRLHDRYTVPFGATRHGYLSVVPS